MTGYLIVWLAAWVGITSSEPTHDIVQLRPMAESVGRYGRIDFEIDVTRQYADPFDPSEVTIDLVMVTPAGDELRLPAFCMQSHEHRIVSRSGRDSMWLYPRGGLVWRARFAPSEEGEYTVVAELQDGEGIRRSSPVTFVSEPAARNGFVRVSRQDPRYFEFSTGAPFFPIGQNLAFVGEGQHVTPARIPEVFRKLSEGGANYLRIWTCCHDWALAIEARKSAWGRSWNWNPPFAAVPDGDDARRSCVHLQADSRPAVPVSPSNSVALVPQTEYVLSGRVRVDPEARFQVSVGNRSLPRPVMFAAEMPWQSFSLRFTTRDREYWLENTELRVEGVGSAWLEQLSLQESGGGPELLWEAAINRPERGFYNPIDCALLDQLVEAAEQHGIYLQLCLITRDAYMDDLKDDTSPEYERAVRDAKNLLRYSVARWGYSTSVAMWEYFNEMDPGLPLDRFYREVGDYLERTDPYRHLRGTSTWHPSARDARHPSLDVADIHYYLRPVTPRQYEDEVAAAVGNASWLREHAPAKPALIAEFGLADTQWRATREMLNSPELVDFHNGLWASALSGASGTAMFWWWERLDTRNHYPVYRPLADFLADIPWTSAQLRTIDADVTESPVRLVGLQGDRRAYFWLFDPEASWESIVTMKREPATLTATCVALKGLAAGDYRVEWFDTRAGRVVASDTVSLSEPVLRLESPSWQRDLACRIVPAP